MRKITIIFMFFYLLSPSINAYGQRDSISDWQEQVLSRIDADDFSEASYARLLEMLSDLELSRRDTVFPKRIRQDIILGSNRCLNVREGYHDVTPEKIEKNKAYRGDMWNHTVRYKLQYGNRWTAGLVLDKDAGEPFRRDFPAFDSYSYYVAYAPDPASMTGVFNVAKAVVGHYRVKLGSGLILNQAFSLGKNIQTDAFMASGTSLSAHSSTDEYNRMHGAAADLRIGNIRLMPFVSYRAIDAVVKNDTITSIPADGYHRTLGEEKKRHSAAVMNSGLHLAYSGSWYEIGANVLYTRFSHPYCRPSRAYNIYYYRGQELLQGSLDYHVRRLGFELRGETAIDQDHNLASIGQIAHAIGEDWQAALSYRCYSQKYQQIYGSGIAESSSMQGENGATLAVTGSPFAYWHLAFSFDYFRFTTPKYGYAEPLQGFESRIAAQYTRGKCDLQFSYRLKSKQSVRQSIDAMLAYSIADRLRLKTQFRCKLYSDKPDSQQDARQLQMGYAIAQAIAWKKEDCPVSADIQAIWFDAKDYDCRIYMSEKNMLYGFGLPMLYGKGMRLSATGACKVSRRIVLELKYSLFRYLDRDHISSGLQKIPSACQNNLWMQIRVKI